MFFKKRTYRSNYKLKMEIWKTIKGFETYEVSSYGKVRNAITGRSLAQQLREYSQVHLYQNGKGYSKLVHRLVADTFIPNPSHLQCIYHKDENTKNNNASNLKWCTHKQSYNYGTQNARISQHNTGKKYKHPRKIKIIAISKNGKKRHFDSISQCARELGVSKPNAYRVLHGYSKTTGGYQIKRDCEA